MASGRSETNVRKKTDSIIVLACLAASHLLFVHPQIQYRTPQSLDPALLTAIFGQLFTVVETLAGPQQASPVTMMLLSSVAPIKEDEKVTPTLLELMSPLLRGHLV